MVSGIVLAVARLYAPPGFRQIAIAFIELVRATPDLMIIFWVYYGLPSLTGVHLNAWPAAVVSLAVIASAYLAEDIRAGINSVPRVQFESAYVSGLTQSQIFFLITLPQAVRNMIPALVATLVRIFKVTSVVFVVGIVEFFRAAVIVNNRDNAPYQIYAFVAIVYFVCCFGISRAIRRFGTADTFAH